jgi:hypothetical protein
MNTRTKSIWHLAECFFVCEKGCGSLCENTLCFPVSQNALAFCNPALPICHRHIVLTLRAVSEVFTLFEKSQKTDFDHMLAKFDALNKRSCSKELRTFVFYGFLSAKTNAFPCFIYRSTQF